MIDMGEFQPTAVLGPVRSIAGTTLGRLTTTEEQRAEVLNRMIQVATEHKDNTVKATVLWSRGEPTILEMVCVTEHLDGKRVWISDRVIEMTPGGGEIPINEEARLRRLSEEVSELHDRGEL